MLGKLSMIMHQAKGIIREKSSLFSRGRTSSTNATTKEDVPKGNLAVYVGMEHKTRFIVPIAYLEHPSFQDLLKKAEEEYEFKYPMGGLTLPCSEETFFDATSNLTRN